MLMPKQIANAFLPWRFDTRVLQRNVVEGVLTQAQVDEFLTELPDVAAKGQEFRTHRSDRLAPSNDDRDD